MPERTPLPIPNPIHRRDLFDKAMRLTSRHRNRPIANLIIFETDFKNTPNLLSVIDPWCLRACTWRVQWKRPVLIATNDLEMWSLLVRQTIVLVIPWLELLCHFRVSSLMSWASRSFVLIFSWINCSFKMSVLIFSCVFHVFFTFKSDVVES